MSQPILVTYLTLILMVSSVFLHNGVSALIGFEEPVFFLLSLLLALFLIVAISYNTYTFLTKGEPKDLWQLGWLGILGVLGVFYQPTWFGLFGFFSYFGTKDWRKK